MKLEEAVLAIGNLLLAIKEREGSIVGFFCISQNNVENPTIITPINVGLTILSP